MPWCIVIMKMEFMLTSCCVYCTLQCADVLGCVGRSTDSTGTHATETIVFRRYLTTRLKLLNLLQEISSLMSGPGWLIGRKCFHRRKSPSHSSRNSSYRRKDWVRLRLWTSVNSGFWHHFRSLRPNCKLTGGAFLVCWDQPYTSSTKHTPTHTHAQETWTTCTCSGLSKIRVCKEVSWHHSMCWRAARSMSTT